MNSDWLAGGDVDWDDSGWVGAGPDDDLEERLAAESEQLDPGAPHVTTALGPIEPAALGVTLFGAWNRPLVPADEDPGAVLLILEQLYATGVRAVVDLASAASAARLTDLAWVSGRSPVHIVVAAHPADLAATPPVQVGADLSWTVATGLSDQSGMGRPRFVPARSPATTDQFSAPGPVADDQWPTWVVADDPDDASLAVWDTLLRSGRGLVLGVGSDEVRRMTQVAATIRALVERGHEDRLALGYHGDPVALMERFPLLLMEAGLSSLVVRRILIDNPGRALTINPGTTAR